MDIKIPFKYGKKGGIDKASGLIGKDNREELITEIN